MPFELQPTLVGTLVEMRPLREDDFPRLFAIASDPLIWEQHPNSDRYREPVFRQFFKEAMDSGGALVAVARDHGNLIGSSRYHQYNEKNREVEIGWTFLARTYWGGRYNGEMKKLMLDHAFRFVDSVIFVIGDQNMRSQRAVQKIGAERIAPRLDQSRADKLVFQMTKDRWENRAIL